MVKACEAHYRKPSSGSKPATTNLLQYQLMCPLKLGVPTVWGDQQLTKQPIHYLSIQLPN